MHVLNPKGWPQSLQPCDNNRGTLCFYSLPCARERDDEALQSLCNTWL